MFPKDPQSPQTTPEQVNDAIIAGVANGALTNQDMINKINSIAKVCHQANKAFCEMHGDFTQVNYESAPEWRKMSAFNGVSFRIDHPDAPHSAQHDSWMAEKVADGWVYGEVKDADKKTHPCIVPFDELPEFQQKKDALFSAIVDALK